MQQVAACAIKDRSPRVRNGVHLIRVTLGAAPIEIELISRRRRRRLQTNALCVQRPAKRGRLANEFSPWAFASIVVVVVGSQLGSNWEALVVVARRRLQVVAQQ